MDKIRFNNVLMSMIESGQFEDFMVYFGECYEAGKLEEFYMELLWVFDSYLERDEAIAISALKAENNKMLMNSK